MTVCAAGGLPIPDPWFVPTEDGKREPMCEVHSMAVDLGRALDESVGIAPYQSEKVQEVLRWLLDLPCPQPAPPSNALPVDDDETREALDRLMPGLAQTPSWESYEVDD